MLRRAERRAALKWEATASTQDRESARGGAGNHLSGVDGSGMPVSAASEEATAEERAALFSKVASRPVVLEQESRLAYLTDRESPTAEAVRLLSVRLRDFRRIRPLKRVLVTSSIPREGKTTISANLACALAHGSTEKTLLIEGDVRLPALRKMFGIESGPGLCELVEQGKNLSECIYRLEDAGIWLLPAGRTPSNPLEVLQSPKLPMVMNQLARCFDWIVIDSPPVLPLADTSIWMRLAEGILLVTRQGITEKQQLQKGLEALESQKVLGALLNCSVASAYSGYYYRSTNQS